MSRHRSAVHLSVLGIVGFFIISLAACTTDAKVAPSLLDSTATASISPNIDATQRPTPNWEELVGEPLSIACTDLVTIKELYDFNPNFALDPSLGPTQSDLLMNTNQLGGVHCTYINLTSGDTIEVFVGRISPSSLGMLEASINQSSVSVPEYDMTNRKVFFHSISGGGLFQAIQGNYWLAVWSKMFASPTDAYSFISPTLNRL